MTTKRRNKEDATIRAILRLPNPRTRSLASTSSSSVNATSNTPITTFMTGAKSSPTRDHSRRSPILTKDQK
ncbi:unnamed protein product [Rotaria sp. Silwood1]|nr:unnamed protein product [Rotaria sp. Silwood1]CAF3951128.1 unnamed protein product [Rotaria sp. Silwood1]CAF5134152.1 unnamed protein product [Rotaria sp. Silwood1]